jgi:hypothetical protein
MLGTYEDYTIRYIDNDNTSSKHTKEARADLLARIEAFSRSLSPGNIVAAGMTEKEFKKREPPFRYDLAIVLESAFKAAKQLSSKADGVTCQIAKGHWAVKLAWLDRIAKETEDNADGDDGDDDHKHTFIVEDTPTIVTGVEGLIRVKGIQVTIDGGDACATVPLPLTQAQRKIVRASHDAIMRTNLSRFSSYH